MLDSSISKLPLNSCLAVGKTLPTTSQRAVHFDRPAVACSRELCFPRMCPLHFFDERHNSYTYKPTSKLITRTVHPSEVDHHPSASAMTFELPTDELQIGTLQYKRSDSEYSDEIQKAIGNTSMQDEVNSLQKKLSTMTCEPPQDCNVIKLRIL